MKVPGSTFMLNKLKRDMGVKNVPVQLLKVQLKQLSKIRSIKAAKASGARNIVLSLSELIELKKVSFFLHAGNDDLIREPYYKPSDSSFVYVYFSSLIKFFAPG
ncbi:MAG: hypothetical protein QM426_01125 [Euryarchaeota archaeon]|nr:hypothetical protein [Euryarchaeota archaeon]